MIGLGILLTFVFGALGAAAFLYNKFTAFADAVDIEKPAVLQAAEPEHDIVKQPFNILLVGVDYRENEPWEGARSDTMIVVHVDPVNKWASMLSIPRDSYAEIPHKGTPEKINAAYPYGYANAEEIYGAGTKPEAGGIYLTKEAVEQFLDLKSHGTRIHYVAQINFEGFQQIIDEIGGINIDVPKPLIDPQYPTDGDHGFVRVFIPAGLQHMDGVTALRYARSRHADDDHGRGARQQQVLRAILGAMRERGLLDQITTGDQILEVLKKTVKTDLPVGDLSALRSLASVGKAMAGDRLQSYSLNDSVEQRTLENYMIFWNEVDLSNLVDQWLTGPGGGSAEEPGANPDETPTPEPGVTVKVLNGTGVHGLAGGVTTCLKQGEYETETPSNAVETYEHTRVIDFTNTGNARHHLLGWLDLDENALLDPDDAPEAISPDGADLVLILGDDYKEAWREC